MSERSELRAPGVNGAFVAASPSGGLVTSIGDRDIPDWTSAAIMAMPSGLTWTPWPTVSAASCPSPDAAGTEPENADSGSCQSLPMPKPLAAWLRPLLVSRLESPANAVPQPWAKSAPRVGSGPRVDDAWPLVNCLPPTMASLVHGISAFADTPAPSSAAVDTIVNALPGVIRAFSAPPAGSCAPGAPWLATARILPVDGCTATISVAA